MNIILDLGLKDCMTSSRSFQNLGKLFESFKDNYTIKHVLSKCAFNSFIFKKSVKTKCVRKN